EPGKTITPKLADTVLSFNFGDKLNFFEYAVYFKTIFEVAFEHFGFAFVVYFIGQFFGMRPAAAQCLFELYYDFLKRMDVIVVENNPPGQLLMFIFLFYYQNIDINAGCLLLARFRSPNVLKRIMHSKKINFRGS